MHSQQICPFCDSLLLCQISQGKLYWFCPHCHQEVPYGFYKTIAEADLIDDFLARNASEPDSCLDELTHLANHSRFYEYIKREWRRMSREQKPLSLILCDLDSFSNYKQKYGEHHAHDCLQKIANVIRSLAKRPADLVARYRLHEFAVVLPNTELRGAIKLAEDIYKQISNLPDSFPTVSVGVASLVPTPQLSLALLVQEAETALKIAKAQGGDRVVCNSKQLQTIN